MSAREVAEQIANNLPWLEDKAAQDYEGAVKEIEAAIRSRPRGWAGEMCEDCGRL